MCFVFLKVIRQNEDRFCKSHISLAGSTLQSKTPIIQMGQIWDQELKPIKCYCLDMKIITMKLNLRETKY